MRQQQGKFHVALGVQDGKQIVKLENQSDMARAPGSELTVGELINPFAADGNQSFRGAIEATDVGSTAAFLLSPLARAITGSVVYVDNGYNAMGMAVPEGA
jgi:hypothetical protein